VPFVAALPSMYARISRVLDRRWLGRRFTAVEAVTRFLTRLKAATTEPQLMEYSQQGLAEIFGAACLIHQGAGSPAGATFAVMHQTPIQSGDAVLGRILMGPRTSQAPYFREDVELLASLADVLASVLINLRLQEKRKEQEQVAQELSLHASRSELKALRAQINPHFLFNALNAIAGLIHQNPRAADRTIEQLAGVFRYALRGAESEWASLGDELEFVSAYLEVERARFGDRLQVEVSAAAEVRDARVPTMAVQTLVENAVKHGLSELRGPAIVQVGARREGDRLVVAVIDNGPGFSDAALAARDAAPGTHGGYGLSNVRRRLNGYFGQDARLSIDRDRVKGRTVVSMSLPLVVDPVTIADPAATLGWTGRARADQETPL
jgi:LytS/YehU family sensor histidine kinase